jgi:NADPH:quinone reductase-like Zn-dependent oxidoreductase
MASAIERNRLEPIVDRTFDFHAVPEALTLMQQGSHFGKIAIAFPGA